MKQVYDRKPRKMARLIYPSCVELGTNTPNVQNTVTLSYGAQRCQQASRLNDLLDLLGL